MIEIPDLNDLYIKSQPDKSFNQFHNNNNLSNGIYNNTVITSNNSSSDLLSNSIDIHKLSDPNISIDHEPEMQDVNHSGLSFDAENDIAPQHIDYTVGLSFLPNDLKEHKTTFKLQDPPQQLQNQRLNQQPDQQQNHQIYPQLPPQDYQQQNGDSQTQQQIKTKLSLNQSLASPMSILPNYDHTEPSPQLPPPLSSLSLQNVLAIDHTGISRKNLATDFKTPAEYTLHIIFTQFVRHAERKLNIFLNYPNNNESALFKIFAEGADPQFDKIVASLGYIARRKPKPVIDSVMFWRKSKSEVATMAAMEVDKALQFAKSNNIATSNDHANGASPAQSATSAKRSLSLMRSKSLSKMAHRRNQSSASAASSIETTNEFKRKQLLEIQVSNAKQTAVNAEKKSLVSIYILCRVLIEVVKQTSSEVMGEDLGDKLEEIVYTQLKTTDPASTSQSIIRAANWNLFAQLLGIMSEKRFLSVSDRFIFDLEKLPQNIKQEDEPKLYLLISGMQYLKLNHYPPELFEDSKEFIQILAKFFERTTNESILYAYCDSIANLILPLANNLTAEANDPGWNEGIEKIYNKAMSVPYPGWAHLLNVITATLSVSRKDLFSSVWFSIIESNSFKLKPKVDVQDKTVYILCITRLLWVYFNRIPDSLNLTVKRLDDLFNLIFFNLPKKGQWLTADPQLIHALTKMIQIIGFNHLNYTLEHLLTKLMRQGFNGSLDTLQPEKMILVVRSYLALLSEFEKEEKPKFPYVDIFDQNMNEEEIGDFQYVAKNSTNITLHEELSKNFGLLLKLLDAQYGSTMIESKSSSSGSAKSQSSFGFHFGSDTTSSKALHLELFADLINSIPFTIAFNESQGGFKQIVELLAKNAIHENELIQNACMNALKRLSKKKNPTTLLTIFAKFAFQLSEKTSSTYDSTYLNSPSFIKLLKLYTDLLETWYESFQLEKPDVSNPLAQDDELMNKDVLNELYQINHKNQDLSNLVTRSKPSDELEWKTIINSVEEVEGNGLFFICSQDSQVRTCGVNILRIVDKFDQAIYNLTNDDTINENPSPKKHSRSSSKFAADVGTRIIHVLEGIDFHDLIKPYKKEVSLPERQRLTKIKNDKKILIKLIESDHGIDSTIWFRLYPKILEILFEKCPMPVAMCRNIVCVSLVQMYELILEYSDSHKLNTSSIFASKSSFNVAPEVLVNQWRLYLIFACTSLTATNEQKISFPSQPTHGRKKSLQMFIQHQKITSAKSIFRMVLPLLKSQQLMVREAVIVGLSQININIFKTFLENIPSAINEWNTDIRKRDFAEDRFRIEIVHILMNLTGKFKSNEMIYDDDTIIANLVSVVKNVKTFLTISSVQIDIDFQRLRRYFCVFLENVFLGLRDKTLLDKWLPFEARISCFNYLKEWCGYGDSAGVSEERYAIITKNINQQQKDSASAIALLEFEKKKLQNSALSCMAILCSGEIKQNIEDLVVVSFDVPVLLNWIQSLLESDNDKVNEIGKYALRNLLTNNFDNTDIQSSTIRQCCTSKKSMPIYFCTYVDVLVKKPKVEKKLLDELVVLGCLLCGNQNFDVRQSAITLLSSLFVEGDLEDFVEDICGESLTMRRKALAKLSESLNSDAETSHIRLSILFNFFNFVDENSRKTLSIIMVTILKNIALKYKEPNQLEATSNMILNNLFEISIKYETNSSTELEAMWIALGTKENFDIIVDYILKTCLDSRNTLFVSKSRQVIDYLAFSHPEKLYVVEKLIKNLQPKMMIPPQPQSIKLNLTKSFPYVADLTTLHCEKDAAFSMGQISMIFLVDLINSKNDFILQKLPLLLHIALTLLDHYLVIVREQASRLLIHLIHSLAISEPKAKEIISLLRDKTGESLWVYDDLNNDKKGARTPNKMIMLVRNILHIFNNIAPTLQDDWSRIALTWGTTCAVRHSACRSFQIFRVLISFLDLNILKAMFHRLSNTISDETADIQGFAMQILMTLNAIAAELDSQKLIDYPQLFWSSVACLSTIHEQEFIEVLSTMNKFISKIDLNAQDTINCLISTFPPKWEGKFEGLQQIVTVGLRSSTSWEPTLNFIDTLLRLKDSQIVGTGDSRIIIALIANMPRFLDALENNTITPEIETTAVGISKLAEASNKPALAKILVSLSKNKFRSKKDFLIQTVTTIQSLFFPEYEVMVLISLLKMLSNTTEFFRKQVLVFLKAIIPHIDFRKEEFIGLGADLISPLLRLLLTNFADSALEVLDEADIISGSQLDKDILRMSLGNTAVKKEYENTATLFGIPEESGWSIPMPAVTSASTRNNVHAVFSTCIPVVDEEQDKEQQDDHDEEIQFHMEDYYSPNAPQDTQDTISMSVEEPEVLLSNMWAALDDFDSFFTTTEKAKKRNTAIHSASELRHSKVPSYSQTPIESAPNTYDKKVSAILNKTLTSTPSFRNNLLEYIGENEPSPAVSTRRSYIPFRSKTLKPRDISTPMTVNSVGFENQKTPHQTPSTISMPTSFKTPLISNKPSFSNVIGDATNTNSTATPTVAPDNGIRLVSKKRSKKK
ncbi:TAO3 [Candida pseudojiufengensis]|uniref:TAO3 n=1 Tax=Candida pseudojiufengensis TaxID=497109 RepID=UPI002224AF89|nr:TAO3 [Candida pseudojiufengensis]KAI5959482.1 TAO3 [Candida pseudojiufengensis]